METGHKDDIGAHDERLRKLETRESASFERWASHEKEHARQARAQVGINTVIAGAFSAITAWFSK
jgi:flagellar motility protein MotE (MotC chaperone)